MKKILVSILITFSLCLIFKTNADANVMDKEVALTDFSSIAHLPVSYDEKYYRYDQFAELILQTILGAKHPDTLNPTKWLTQLVLNDPRAFQERVFAVHDTSILKALHLETKDAFTLTEIMSQKEKIDDLYTKTNQIDEQYRGDTEKNIIRLYQNLNLLVNLSKSFDFAVPSASFHFSQSDIQKHLGLDANTQYYSYLDIILSVNKLLPYFDKLEGKDRSAWSKGDTEVFAVVKNLYQYKNEQGANSTLRIIATKEEGLKWLNPAEFINTAITEQNHFDIIVLLNNLYGYAVDGENDNFDLTLDQFVKYNTSIYAESADQKQIEQVLRNDASKKEKGNIAYLAVFILIFLGMVFFIKISK